LHSINLHLSSTNYLRIQLALDQKQATSPASKEKRHILKYLWDSFDQPFTVWIAFSIFQHRLKIKLLINLIAI